jgi:Family of unknown function (DUF6065)
MSLPLIAYHEARGADLPLVPASRRRDWLDNGARHGRRCLPLTMANEAGWFVLNNRGFTAVWSGENDTEAVSVDYDDDLAPHYRAHSQFGFGVVSFMVPYLFRTPKGYNLLVRGPANMPKDGIWPLEGLVETDWAVQTFTMNWKLTRPDAPVRFEPGDPICMLLPQRRGELEQFAPELRDFDSAPEIRSAYAKFGSARHDSLVRSFIAEHVQGVEHPDYEKHYMQGKAPDGSVAPEHQKKLKLGEFQPAASAEPGT